MLNYFFRVGAMAKIIFFEFVAAAGFSYFASNFIGLVFYRSCDGYHGELAFFTTIIVLFFAYLAAQGTIMRIWYASYGLEGTRNVLKVGSWILPNIFMPSTTYYMPSTHPIYVLVDWVTAAVGGFFLWASLQVPRGDCGWSYHYYFGWSFLIIGVFFSLFRLYAWYVLKRQIPREECKGVWWPVLIFWLLALAMIIPGIIVSYR